MQSHLIRFPAINKINILSSAEGRLLMLSISCALEKKKVNNINKSLHDAVLKDFLVQGLKAT